MRVLVLRTCVVLCLVTVAMASTTSAALAAPKAKAAKGASAAGEEPTLLVPPKEKAAAAPPSATVDQLAGSRSAAPSSRELGLRLSPKIGASVSTAKLGTTPMAGLEVAYDLDALRALLGLPGMSAAVAVELDYLEPGHSGNATSATAGTFAYSLRQRLVVATLEGVLRYLVFGVEPYAGLGLGLYFLRAKVTAFGQANTQSQTRLGAQVRAGAGYALGMGQVFGELRYHYVGLDFPATGSSNAAGITLAAGYRFAF